MYPADFLWGQGRDISQEGSGLSRRKGVKLVI